MSELKSNPLPWHVATNGCTKESGGEPAFPGVHDASGREHGEDIVCSCLGTSEQCKENAALIVKAVNCHHSLLEALRKIANFDAESIWGDDRDAAASQMLSIAQESLDKTKEVA